MRLTYVSNSTFPARTANSIHCMRMAEAFAAAGHAVRLIGKASSEMQNDPFEYYGSERSFTLDRIGSGREEASRFRYVAGIQRALRGSPPDLAYARSPEGAAIALSLGLPTVYEVHAVPVSHSRRALERWLLRRRRLMRVVFISGQLRDDYLTDIAGPVAGDVVVAHDGANPATRFADDPLPGARRPRVGYAGSLFPGKGAELVPAIARLSPNWSFHVFGGESEQVAALAVNSPSNVTWHGHVAPACIPRLLQAMDALLLPAQPSTLVAGGRDIGRWMSPLKLFEYLGAGRPVLCSDLPVLREVMRDGVNGILVDPTDPQAWASHLDRLVRDRSLAARLGEAGRATLESDFSWRARARRVLEGL